MHEGINKLNVACSIANSAMIHEINQDQNFESQPFMLYTAKTYRVAVPTTVSKASSKLVT